MLFDAFVPTILTWSSQESVSFTITPGNLYQKGLVLQYQLHNRVENLADVLTRCSGLLQGEDKRASGQNVGKVFNPVVKLVLENQPFLMPEPAEKPSLHRNL